MAAKQTKPIQNKQSIQFKKIPNIQQTNNLPASNKYLEFKYPILALIALCFIVYFPVLSYGITELDDSIFITEFKNYYADFNNLFTSFHRGLFDAVKDPYYRPLFLDAMMINNWISDGGENLIIYHLINLLLHIGAIILLYKLFLKINIPKIHAFVLSVFFAIHPVLCQDVAWIPGRNDTMLAIFILAFLIQVINYVQASKINSLLYSVLFLLLAYFTKETAVFAAPVALVIISLLLNEKIGSKKNLVLFGTWVGCFLLWYLVRAGATVQNSVFSPDIVHDFIYRLPVVIQYIGKIIFPINQSVFPIQADTTIIIGLVATGLLVLILVLNNERKNKIIYSGVAIFFLFLLPALIVPTKLNEQTFEHRLYLPMIGVLLIFSQSILFSKILTTQNFYIISGSITLLFAGANYVFQPNFADPISFWKQAATTSPHSAYAAMMYGARDKNIENSKMLFRKAYQLNPKEKYINFYMAEMLQKYEKPDSIIASEKYLLVEKEISNYYRCDFLLARVYVEKHDLPKAIVSLESLLKRVPEDSEEGRKANNNLLKLYIDMNVTDKIISQAKHMRAIGMPVPGEVLRDYHL